jgi:hypothetical protein
MVVELSAAIIRSHADQITGIMAIGRDITARRAREQADHERIARLERQVAALTEAIARAGNGTVDVMNCRSSTSCIVQVC